LGATPHEFESRILRQCLTGHDVEGPRCSQWGPSTCVVSVLVSVGPGRTRQGFADLTRRHPERMHRPALNPRWRPRACSVRQAGEAPRPPCAGSRTADRHALPARRAAASNRDKRSPGASGPPAEARTWSLSSQLVLASARPHLIFPVLAKEFDQGAGRPTAVPDRDFAPPTFQRICSR
jgi:hypothetical protein